MKMGWKQGCLPVALIVLACAGCSTLGIGKPAGDIIGLEWSKSGVYLRSGTLAMILSTAGVGFTTAFGWGIFQKVKRLLAEKAFKATAGAIDLAEKANPEFWVAETGLRALLSKAHEDAGVKDEVRKLRGK